MEADGALILRDGGLHFRRADGGYQPLRWSYGGAIVEALVDGWRACWLHRGFAPLTLIELEGPQGDQATWYADQEGFWLGDTASRLPLPAQEILIAGLRRMQTDRTAEGLRLLADYVRIWPGSRLDIESLLPNPVHDRALELGQAAIAQSASGRRLHLHEAFHPLIGAGASARLAAPLVLGWRIDEARVVADGKRSVIAFEGLPICGACYLSIVLGPVRLSRRLRVSVNGRLIAITPLHGLFHGERARFGYWIAPELVQTGQIEIVLQQELLSPVASDGLILEQVRLELAKSDQDQAVVLPDPATLMLSFQSIGDNCQFGFVQRHFGAEPIGLLRFAGLPDIVAMLEAGITGLGEPGTLRTIVAATEYQIYESRFGLFYHTFRYEGEIGEAALIAENETKLRYLARKFQEDLEDAQTIWVSRRIVSNDIAEIMALHAAMRRYGPNKLLWVTPAPDDRAAGDVEWLTQDILRGYLAADAVNDPLVIDAATWLTLCQNAYRAFRA